MTTGQGDTRHKRASEREREREGERGGLASFTTASKLILKRTADKASHAVHMHARCHGALRKPHPAAVHGQRLYLLHTRVVERRHGVQTASSDFFLPNYRLGYGHSVYVRRFDKDFASAAAFTDESGDANKTIMKETQDVATQLPVSE
jgi:hypothetical protein